MNQYYFLDKDKKQWGPIPARELYKYNLDAYTLVWCNGMKRWAEVRYVKELDFLLHHQSPYSSSLVAQPLMDASLQDDSRQIAKPMFVKPLSIAGRAGRLEYWLSFFILWVGIYTVGGMAVMTRGIGLILALPLAWFMIAESIKRCHDTGRSGWVLLIPFYFLWLLFAKGDRDANYYGESTK